MNVTLTNLEAYKRAIGALNAADEDQSNAYLENGGGWGAMDSFSIREHIEAFIAHAFKQGPLPRRLTEGGED